MVLVAVKPKRRSTTRIAEMAPAGWSGEAVAFCPQCKAIQTVWIEKDNLLPTRKFFQEGGEVYHDCGSNLPCRLYTGL